MRPSLHPAWASTDLAQARFDAARMERRVAMADRETGEPTIALDRAASMAKGEAPLALDALNDANRVIPGFEGVETLKALFAEGGPVAGLGQGPVHAGGMLTSAGASPAHGGEGS